MTVFIYDKADDGVVRADFANDYRHYKIIQSRCINNLYSVVNVDVGKLTELVRATMYETG